MTMNLTNEQIAALADKGAEAAKIFSLWPIQLIDSEQLQTFAKKVIDEYQQLVVQQQPFELASALADKARLENEVAALQDWKESMLQVESEWDVQKMAKALGGTIGASCREIISKAVDELVRIRALAADEGDLVTWKDLHTGAKAFEGQKAKWVNSLHRERIAAVRAADRAEIDSLKSELSEIRETLYPCLDRDRDNTTTPHLATVAHNALLNARAELAALKTPAPEGVSAGEVLWNAKYRFHPSWESQSVCRKAEVEHVAQTLLAWAEARKPSSEDSMLLDWLDKKTKESRTGISFDYLAKNEYRYMQRHFIGEPAKNLREAIKLAMEVENGKPLGPIHKQDPVESPPAPEGFHPATAEELQCLPVGSLYSFWGGEWDNSTNIGEKASQGCEYICPNTKPEPETTWIPLEAADVSPADIFRFTAGESIWEKVVALTKDGVALASGSIVTPWHVLFDEVHISRDNGDTWERCRKVAPLSSEPRITSVSKE